MARSKELSEKTMWNMSKQEATIKFLIEHRMYSIGKFV